jgi:CheY-like chemotaxis protein
MSYKKSNFHILVTDDDDTEIELISYAIGEMNPRYRIDTASNGEDALDYLYRRGPHAGREEGLPLLVILDNKMPIMNGIETLREIRKDPEFDGMPVVMFTASSHWSDIADAFAAGANSYVIKPMDEFDIVVQAIVHYWTRVNLHGV